MTSSELLFFLLGLGLLLGGAELLVRGSTRLARALRISPLVIGLTVVAFGTSSPELAASITAARTGGDLALGNVVGSNVFNVLFILGAAALIAPLTVARKLVRLDVPILIGITLLVPILGRDGTITRPEGLFLIGLLVAYLTFLIVEARREGVATANAGDRSDPPGRLGVAAVSALLGLAMLTFGAGWLVDGAVALARSFGVGDLVIGLTLVAAGTSLPEVATSLLASMRGERDIAVGNVVGSNVFNLLAVLGVSAVVAPTGVAVASSARAFDLPFLVAVTIACLPIFFTDLGIDRWEGGLFLALWVAYTTQLLVAARAGIVASPVLLIVAVLIGVGALSAVRWRTARAAAS